VRALLGATFFAAAVVSAGCTGGGSTASAAATSAPRPAYKVTVAGDSISVGLGAALRNHVADDVDVKVIGESGTGLARPDTFDWPERLERLAREFPPRILVLSLSSNDAQDLRAADGSVVARYGTPAWDAEYRRRLGAAFDAFAGQDTRVVWVGHVRTNESTTSRANRDLHRLATEVAAERRGVTVADLGELLGTGDAVATRCLTEDQLHLTTACLDEAAARLEDRLAALRGPA
jgi:hypothetical protein